MSDYATNMLTRVNTELPDLDPDLARLYTLLALTQGTATTLEDVHYAWAVWTTTTRGGRRSLVPFSELDSVTQELDRDYMSGIHRAAMVGSS